MPSAFIATTASNLAWPCEPGLIDPSIQSRTASTISALVGSPAGAGAGSEDGGSARSRSEEHTSELQSLMRISYAVFCLKKKKKIEYYYSPNTRIKKTTQ